jgi:uncharacterized protein (TIGR02266 family)
MGDQTNGGAREADRRVDERIPARVEVRFGEPGQAARALRAFSVNFSSGGLCLRTTRRYEVGASLHLDLDVAGESWALTGVVAWVRDGAVGIRFENVNNEDRARLLALVQSLRS